MKDSHSGRALLPSKLPRLWAEASSAQVSSPWGNTGPLFQDKKHAEVTPTMPFFTLAISCPHLNIDACAEHLPAAAELVKSNLQQKGPVLSVKTLEAFHCVLLESQVPFRSE